jgi:hypothetical protein
VLIARKAWILDARCHERLVGRQEGDAFGPGDREEHAVEGIAVRLREIKLGQDVLIGQRQNSRSRETGNQGRRFD